MSALRFLCLVMLILFFAACISYEHGTEDTQLNELSTLKVDMMRKRTRGRKMALEEVANGDLKKQETLMKLKKQGETTKKSFTRVVGRGRNEVDEEDGLVAYTADYWRARHHPPKNN